MLCAVFCNKICCKLFFLGLFCVYTLSASDFISPTNARNSALANSTIALYHSGIVLLNPAGIAGMSSPSFMLSSNNRYMLPELNTSSLSAIIPVSVKGTGGISASYFGNSRFNKQQYTMCYSHVLGDRINAGISFDYLSARLPDEYGHAYALLGEIGMLVQATERVSVGVHAYNISNSSVKPFPDEELSCFMAAGAAYTDKLFVLTSQVKINKNEPAEFSAGAEIIPIKHLALRLGISTNALMSYTFGIGYNLAKINADIAFMKHPVLGFSSGISVQISLGNKK